MQVLADLVQVVNPAALQQIGSSGLLSQVKGAQVQLKTPYFLRNVIKKQAPFVFTSQMCPLNDCAIPSVAICPYVYRACNGSLVYASFSQRCAPPCLADTATSPSPTPSPSPSPVKSASSMVQPHILVVLLSLVVLGLALM